MVTERKAPARKPTTTNAEMQTNLIPQMAKTRMVQNMPVEGPFKRGHQFERTEAIRDWEPTRAQLHVMIKGALWWVTSDCLNLPIDFEKRVSFHFYPVRSRSRILDRGALPAVLPLFLSIQLSGHWHCAAMHGCYRDQPTQSLFLAERQPLSAETNNDSQDPRQNTTRPAVLRYFQ